RKASKCAYQTLLNWTISVFSHSIMHALITFPQTGSSASISDKARMADRAGEPNRYFIKLGTNSKMDAGNHRPSNYQMAKSSSFLLMKAPTQKAMSKIYLCCVPLTMEQAGAKHHLSSAF